MREKPWNVNRWQDEKHLRRKITPTKHLRTVGTDCGSVASLHRFSHVTTGLDVHFEYKINFRKYINYFEVNCLGRTEGASRIDRIRNADTRSRMGMNTGIVSRKRQGEYVINAPRSIRMVNIRHSKLAFLEHVYGKRGRKGRKRGNVEDRLHSLILESTYAKIWHRTADVYFVFCTRALLDHKLWIDLLGLVYLQLYSYLCS